MTVKELKELLDKYNEDSDIFVLAGCDICEIGELENDNNYKGNGTVYIKVEF